ncbi:MAG: phosphatidylglycerol lysyltransferase domain-containing protein [Candidatus Omnitrophota bacterium]
MTIPGYLREERNLFNRFTAQRSFDLSAFSFVSLFAWRDFYNISFQIIDGNLCVFAYNALGCFQALPPLGTRVTQRTLDKCFAVMDTHNHARGFSRIENVQESQLKMFPNDRYTFYKKCDEFVYQRAEISSLKGNKFKSKRNSYNYFKEHYNAAFLPYQKNMRSACLALYGQWAKRRKKENKDDIYRQMIKENYPVQKTVLGAYQDLGLIGRVVMIDGKIHGYTFGYPLNRKTFCVLFEITDLDKKGLSVFIFREFCHDQELKAFAYINAMDDCGLENIRTAKQSFRPHHLVPAYVVSRK